MSILPIRPPRGPFDSVFDEGDYWPDEIKRPNSLANLIVGLGGMFHQPPMQLGINFHPPRPRQDPWFNNWNIGISPGMEELPDYPKAEDSTTGGDIARAWHQMQKDFAHRTMNENFPSYKPHKPQPFNANQSYDDYMNEHKLVLRNLDPFFLNNYQRAKPQAFSLFGKEEAPVQNADAPKASTPQGQPEEPGFFKPLDQMLKEVEERNTRGEFFDESGKWVKRNASANEPVVFKQPFENAGAPIIEGQQKAELHQFPEPFLPWSNKPYPGNIRKTHAQIAQNDADFERTMGALNLPEYKKIQLREIRLHENRGGGPEDYRLHHPGQASGPTEGMGVDWGQKHRTPAGIEQQALAAGFSPEEARMRAQLAMRTAGRSAAFVEENRSRFSAPTHEQAIKLTLNDPHMKNIDKKLSTITNVRPLTPQQQAGLAQMYYVSGSLLFDKKFEKAISSNNEKEVRNIVDQYLNQVDKTNIPLRKRNSDLERRMSRGLDLLFPVSGKK
ncbi:MAG: hypothetical protein AB7G80_09250 [Dongiaceae bacterium]